ncbi:MAG TPA: isoprenylcysteine carboxylmethyltransferase family protein [Methylomirabilota bacterium]|jgi:methyltransferase|nr:isoprenylcysteine carboxylmethyltransferase family protein [Methylomirabilota bacterium]
MTVLWYFVLLSGFALLRVAELIVSRRHQDQLLREGGQKIAEPTYPLMIGVHTLLFVGSTLEVWLLQRPFFPWLGWPMLGLLVCCIAGRVWVWRSLGTQWHTQIMASPLPVIHSGPYHYVRHPNYTIVIVEMFAIPLAHSAYVTASGCSALNALVLSQRIRLEEAALLTREDYRRTMAGKPRFLPTFHRTS